MRVQRTIFFEPRGLGLGQVYRLFLARGEVLERAAERIRNGNGGGELDALGAARKQLAERAERDAARRGKRVIGDSFSFLMHFTRSEKLMANSFI